MKSLKRDRATISNDHRELKRAARNWGCMPSDVLRAKEQTSSRRRVVIKSWLEDNGIIKPKTKEDANHGETVS